MHKIPLFEKPDVGHREFVSSRSQKYTVNAAMNGPSNLVSIRE